DSLGYTAMTPVQAASLPLILAGRDVIAQAKTGSGKTAAFGLGLLARLDVQRFRVQVLVLCPTRELADQVAKEIRKLARTIHNIKVLTLCGGQPFGPQLGSLEHGAHLIVGTPGRVEEHLRKGSLQLDDLRQLVLDEADRMLDMGFQPSLDAILEQLPAQRQTLLFSATYPPGIEGLAARVLRDPERVSVESRHDADSIAQAFHLTADDNARRQALRRLLLIHRPNAALVFCNTKQETDALATWLNEQGFSALALHGDLEQKDRDLALQRFAGGSASLLVATDVAARGLDIAGLDAVFNYHLPRDREVYVHRIGRTGRAGASGLAFSFLAPAENHKLEALSETLGLPLAPTPLPPEPRGATPYRPAMITLQIGAGKEQKLRPGDILGAL